MLLFFSEVSTTNEIPFTFIVLLWTQDLRDRYPFYYLHVKHQTYVRFACVCVWLTLLSAVQWLSLACCFFAQVLVVVPQWLGLLKMLTEEDMESWGTLTHATLEQWQSYSSCWFELAFFRCFPEIFFKWALWPLCAVQWPCISPSTLTGKKWGIEKVLRYFSVNKWLLLCHVYMALRGSLSYRPGLYNWMCQWPWEKKSRERRRGDAVSLKPLCLSPKVRGEDSQYLH